MRISAPMNWFFNWQPDSVILSKHQADENTIAYTTCQKQLG